MFVFLVSTHYHLESKSTDHLNTLLMYFIHRNNVVRQPAHTNTNPISTSTTIPSTPTRRRMTLNANHHHPLNMNHHNHHLECLIAITSPPQPPLAPPSLAPTRV